MRFTDKHGDKTIRLSSNGLILLVIASEVAEYSDRNNSINLKFFTKLTSRSYCDEKVTCGWRTSFT